MRRFVACAASAALTLTSAGCADSGVAAPGSVNVTYEVRHHRPTAKGPVVEFTARHEFSGDWTSWSDVTTSPDDEAHNRAGQHQTVYKDGVVTSDGMRDRVGDPGQPFNPGPLFNLQHAVVSGGEQLLADDATSNELRELRDRVAEQLRLEPETLRATRVEETGLCGRGDHGCPTGVLTAVTTAVFRPSDALPLHVTEFDNGILNSEMRVLSLK